MCTDSHKRTERQKVIDKLLLLYIIKELEDADQPTNEERIQLIVWAVQKFMQANNVETFSYDDWEWEEEEPKDE